VTVGAKHAEILKTMVVADSVDVIDLHGQPAPLPFFEPAYLASVLDETGAKQPPLDVRAGAFAR
jgi:hypothetical protein